MTYGFWGGNWKIHEDNRQNSRFTEKKIGQSRITGKIKDSNSRFTKKIKLNSRITEKIRGGQFTVHEENNTQFTVHSKNKSPITVHENTSLRPSIYLSRDTHSLWTTYMVPYSSISPDSDVMSNVVRHI